MFSKEVWVTAFWARLATAAAAAAAPVKIMRGQPLVSVCGYSASLGLNSRYASWRGGVELTQHGDKSLHA